jgi:HAL2 family 3'(2'),5'-bisphosphate nucleotidase
MDHPYTRELVVAIGAVREASRLCIGVRGSIDPGVLDKKDLSPVTVADFGSQALVCRALAEAFPHDPVVAEEDADELRREEGGGVGDAVLRNVREIRPEAEREEVYRWIDHGGAEAGAARFWTLDPIDGTKGFLRSEQYAIALALIVEGRLVVSALACPNLPDPEGLGVGMLFTAVRGRGAAARPLTGDGEGRTIRVSSVEDPSAARFCESVESAHSAHGPAAEIAERLGIKTPPLRLDSQAKYAVVARGEAEIYLRLPTRADRRELIWDHAAGALIIAEAGGMVTDLDGNPLDWTRGRRLEANRGTVVTNGRFHDRVLDAARAIGI